MTPHIASIVRVFLLAVTAVMIASCDRAQPGGENAAQNEELRLAVLSPAISATLLEMGLREHIVARHAYDMVLDRSIPSAGDETALDVETLVRARPTHVLIDAMSRESLKYVQDSSERFGWEVLAFDLSTLDAIDGSATKLRDLFAPDDGDALEAIHAYRRAVSPRRFAFEGGVLLLAQTNPPGAIGPVSFHGEILDRFGVRNVLPSDDRWRELDAEDVLRLNPEAIILIRWRDPGDDPDGAVQAALDLLGPLANLQIRAMTEGRVALIDDPLALIPSLALARFADRLGEILDSFDR